MKIELKQISVEEIVKGYIDSEDTGVIGYNGKLNIRPAYQREFIYNDKKRNAVMNTIQHDFPLGIFYWSHDGNGNYEMLDGQQRTISFCKYCAGEYSINSRAFHNLTKEERDQILKYKCTIYICEGTAKEKLDWFNVINIAGEPLLAQEIRNAIYSGPWVTDAKKYFSKNGCPAYKNWNKYLSGSAIRQDYFEKALEWQADKENKKIEDIMSEHQHDTSASPLWLFFNNIMSWVDTLFTEYRKEMKSVPWGELYNSYSSGSYDPAQFENRIKELMMDDDVKNKSGIYSYIFDNNEKHLNIRAFGQGMKREAYERQNGVCPHCVRDHFQTQHYEIEEMEADHITPWSEGGKTTADNCQMLCKYHNRVKSNK